MSTVAQSNPTHLMPWSILFGRSDSSDLVLKSSDGVCFAVHKLILTLASPVFRGMFEVAHESQPEEPISLTENRSTLEHLLKLVYPFVNAHFETLDDALSTLHAAHKYEATAAAKSVISQITASRTLSSTTSPLLFSARLLDKDPLRVYAVARQFEYHDLESAAREAWLNIDPLESIKESPEVDGMPFKWYRDLSMARIRRQAWIEAQRWTITKGKGFFDTEPVSIEMMKTDILKYPTLKRIRMMRNNAYQHKELDGLVSTFHNWLGLFVVSFIRAFPESNIEAY